MRGTNLNDLFVAAVGAEGLVASWSIKQCFEYWSQLVDQIEEGYSFAIYEYENELFVRDVFARALLDDSVVRHPYWADRKLELDAIDQRMSDLLHDGPEVRPDDVWWRARLPRRAGSELAEGAARLIGVRVEVTES